MRDDKGQHQGVASMEDQTRSVWSAPKLTVVAVDELTLTSGGFGNDAVLESQS